MQTKKIPANRPGFRYYIRLLRQNGRLIRPFFLDFLLDQMLALHAQLQRSADAT